MFSFRSRTAAHKLDSIRSIPKYPTPATEHVSLPFSLFTCLALNSKLFFFCWDGVPTNRRRHTFRPPLLSKGKEEGRERKAPRTACQPRSLQQLFLQDIRNKNRHAGLLIECRVSFRSPIASRFPPKQLPNQWQANYFRGAPAVIHSVIPTQELCWPSNRKLLPVCNRLQKDQAALATMYPWCVEHV